MSGRSISPCGHRSRRLVCSRTRRRRKLAPETRLAILWIKDAWHRLPSYPDLVGGVDVYNAVLEHGVRTPKQFGRYLRRRGLPAPQADARSKLGYS